jgi:hypothetical protein
MNTKTLKNTLNLFQSIIRQDKLNVMSDLIEISVSKNKLIQFGATNKKTAVVYKNVLNDEKDTPMSSITVQLSRLNSIVKLLDNDHTYLYNKGDYLMIVSGKGKYKVEAMFDENGDKIDLPISMPENKDSVEFFVDNAKEIISRGKCSIPEVLSHPEFQRFVCVDGKTVSTNALTISIINTKLPFNELDNEIVEHISKIPRNLVNISKVANGYRISTDNIEVYEKVTTTKDIFPTSILTPFFNYKDFPHFSVSKMSFLNALKRSDFIRNVIDYPKVNITLSKDGVLLESTTGQTKEELEVTASTDNTVKGTFLLDKLVKYVKLLDVGSINIYMNEGKYIVLEDTVGCYTVGGYKED